MYKVYAGGKDSETGNFCGGDWCHHPSDCYDVMMSGSYITSEWTYSDYQAACKQYDPYCTQGLDYSPSSTPEILFIEILILFGIGFFIIMIAFFCWCRCYNRKQVDVPDLEERCSTDTTQKSYANERHVTCTQSVLEEVRTVMENKPDSLGYSRSVKPMNFATVDDFGRSTEATTQQEVGGRFMDMTSLPSEGDMIFDTSKRFVGSNDTEEGGRAKISSQEKVSD